jgi:hypothetical protein
VEREHHLAIREFQRIVMRVHVVFGLVRALSADEARILQSLAHKPIRQVTTSKLDRMRNLFEPSVFEAFDVPDGLAFPSNSRIYLEHLHQLGLIEVSVTRSPESIMASGVQVGVRNFGEHQLSLWGQQFIRACLGDVVVSSPNPGLVPVGPGAEACEGAWGALLF